MTTLHPTHKHLDYDKVQDHIVSQIKHYVTDEAHSKACVVGISGGIDSATVSTLCAKTNLPTILVSMPIHQNLDELNRADNHIQRLQNTYLNVKTHMVDLTNAFETVKESLLNLGHSQEDLYMALVNTRSRLRMAILYAIAQTNKGLVIGTGNKVEDYGIGFFTKYGDGGVDLSPIGDLLKSEVRKLADHMGVHKDIITAKPTDGLHPTGATDEDQIGATYDELERAMEQHDLGLRAQDFDPDTREYHVMNIYDTRHTINAHKMEMPPVITIPADYKQ